MGLSARVITSFAARLSSALDLASAESTLEPRYAKSWSDGSGANQASKIFSDRRPVAGAATDSIDLAGTLSSPIGGTITFSAIKELFLKADDGNAGNLLVGEGIANAWQGPFGAAAVGLILPPGGIIHLRNPSAGGWAVTAGTGDLLAVENLAGSGTANFDLILIGI